MYIWSLFCSIITVFGQIVIASNFMASSKESSSSHTLPDSFSEPILSDINERDTGSPSSEPLTAPDGMPWFGNQHLFDSISAAIQDRGGLVSIADVHSSSPAHVLQLGSKKSGLRDGGIGTRRVKGMGPTFEALVRSAGFKNDSGNEKDIVLKISEIPENSPVVDLDAIYLTGLTQNMLRAASLKARLRWRNRRSRRYRGRYLDEAARYQQSSSGPRHHLLSSSEFADVRVKSNRYDFMSFPRGATRCTIGLAPNQHFRFQQCLNIRPRDYQDLFESQLPAGHTRDLNRVRTDTTVVSKLEKRGRKQPDSFRLFDEHLKRHREKSESTGTEGTSRTASEYTNVSGVGSFKSAEGHEPKPEYDDHMNLAGERDALPRLKTSKEKRPKRWKGWERKRQRGMRKVQTMPTSLEESFSPKLLKFKTMPSDQDKCTGYSSKSKETFSKTQSQETKSSKSKDGSKTTSKDSEKKDKAKPEPSSRQRTEEPKKPLKPAKNVPKQERRVTFSSTVKSGASRFMKSLQIGGKKDEEESLHGDVYLRDDSLEHNVTPGPRQGLNKQHQQHQQRRPQQRQQRPQRGAASGSKQQGTSRQLEESTAREGTSSHHQGSSRLTPAGPPSDQPRQPHQQSGKTTSSGGTSDKKSSDRSTQTNFDMPDANQQGSSAQSRQRLPKGSQ